MNKVGHIYKVLMHLYFPDTMSSLEHLLISIFLDRVVRFYLISPRNSAYELTNLHHLTDVEQNLRLTTRTLELLAQIFVKIKGPFVVA